MGEPLKAEAIVKHFACIVSPSIAATPFGSRQVFGTAAVTFAVTLMPAFQTYGNSAPLFLKRSTAVMPTGMTFKPSECLQNNPVEQSYATSHGHMGTIKFPNGGTVPGAINCGVLPGPNADCSAELEGLLEAIAERMAAEFIQDPLKFMSQFKSASDATMLAALGDTAKGWWDTISGAAVAVGGAIKDGAVASYDYVSTHSVSEIASDTVSGAQAAYEGAVEFTSDAIEFIGNGIDALKQLSFEDVKQIFKEWLREVFGELVCSLRDALAQMAADPRPMATQLGEIDGMAKAFVAETAGAILVDTFVTKGAMSAASKIGRVAGKVGPKLGSLMTRFKNRIAARRAGKLPDQPSKTPNLPEPKKTPHAPEPEKKPTKDGVDGTAAGAGNPQCLLCPTQGEPVNTIYGCKILAGEIDLDFRIDSALPLEWQRTYVSSNRNEGWLGQGWSVPLSFHLDIEADSIVFVDTQGRRIAFPPIAVGEEFFSPYEHTRLRRTHRNQYELLGADGARIVFGLAPSDFSDLSRREALEADQSAQFERAIVLAGEPKETLAANRLASSPQAQTLVMLGLIDSNGNWQRIHYTSNDLPHVVETSSGRRIGLIFDTPDSGHTPRLQKVVELVGEPDSDGRFIQSHALVEYTYNEHRDLAAVLDERGESVRTFSWANHMLVEHAQPDGVVSRYEWDRLDPRGRVIRNSLSTGEDLSFVYDEHAGRTVVTNASGHVTEYRYDKKQLLVALIDPTGGETRYERDIHGNVIAETSPAGNVTRYSYDARGNLIGVELPDGGRYRLTYDMRRHRLLSIADPLDRTTTYRHDDRGNLVEVELSDGSLTRYQLNASGRPVAITDARGGTSQLRYDTHARLVAQVDCLGQEISYSYDDRGDLASITDAAGNATRFRYVRANRRSRVSAIVHPSGALERFSYDRLGRLIAYVDALGNATRYVLAADGKPLRRDNAAGHSIVYQYDTHRRLVALTNENGAMHRFAWDALDRLIAEQGFDGRRQDNSYDADSNLLETADGVPAASALMARGVPGVLRTHYRRDASGRLLVQISVKPNGRFAPTTRTSRFSYDAAGQLICARNASARIELSYNATGQIVREAIRSRNGTAATLLHEYDGTGNRLATILPDGRRIASRVFGSGIVDQIDIDGNVVCEFERDRLNRETVRTQGGIRTHFEHDAAGRLIASRVRERKEIQGLHAIFPTAESVSDSSGTAIVRQYRYDAAGQLTLLADARQGSWHYRYDKAEHLVAVQSPRMTELFSFDPAGNPLDMDPHTGQEPAAGKKAAVWTDAEWSEYVRQNVAKPDFNVLLTPQELAAGPQAWEEAKPNRLLVYRQHRYRYDIWGNCVEKRSGSHDVKRLFWDAEHQLERIQCVSQRGTEIWAYEYDAFGRRIAKFRLSNSSDDLLTSYRNDRKYRRIVQAASSRPEARRFVWDGNRLLLEYSREQQLLYLYEPGSFAPLALVRSGAGPTVASESQELPQEMRGLKERYPDQWAALEERRRRLMAKLATEVDEPAPKSAAEVFYLHTDHLGTPREATDAAGNIVWSASYRALGRCDIQAASDGWLMQEGSALRQVAVGSVLQQNLRFLGQYFDDESGLHYNRYRYYDPDCGRFVSQDPVGLWGGDNTYLYAPNSINYTDEFGLKFGSSTALGRAITGRSSFPGRQPHHMIPVQAFNRNSKGGSMLQNLQNCGLFNLDGKGNGIMLPETPSPGTTRAKHRGFHSVYNQAMIDIIEEIAATTPCAKDQAKKIQSLQSRIHESLRTGKMSLYKPTTKADWLNFLRK